MFYFNWQWYVPGMKLESLKTRRRLLGSHDDRNVGWRLLDLYTVPLLLSGSRNRAAGNVMQYVELNEYGIKANSRGELWEWYKSDAGERRWWALMAWLIGGESQSFHEFWNWKGNVYIMVIFVLILLQGWKLGFVLVSLQCCVVLRGTMLHVITNWRLRNLRWKIILYSCSLWSTIMFPGSL